MKEATSSTENSFFAGIIQRNHMFFTDSWQTLNLEPELSDWCIYEILCLNVADGFKRPNFVVWVELFASSDNNTELLAKRQRVFNCPLTGCFFNGKQRPLLVKWRIDTEQQIRWFIFSSPEFIQLYRSFNSFSYAYTRKLIFCYSLHGIDFFLF